MAYGQNGNQIKVYGQGKSGNTIKVYGQTKRT